MVDVIEWKTLGGPGGYTTTATSVDFGGVGGDTAAMSTTCTAYGGPSPEPFICGSTGSNTTPGVWTSPAAKAPEIDPASAGSDRFDAPARGRRYAARCRRKLRADLNGENACTAIARIRAGLSRVGDRCLRSALK